MDLKNGIIKAQSKSNIVSVLDWIGEDMGKVDQLIDIFQKEDMKLTHRASWVITSLAERCPWVMERHLPVLIGRMLDDRVHVGVRRNMIRSLQFMEIPSSLQGRVLDACFSFLDNPKEGNVVQVFAMSVIEKLTKEYPEIIPELRYLIERNLENDPSPAFRSRARKTLMRLK